MSEFNERYVGHRISFVAVTNEMRELFAARSLENLKEEMNDVCFVFQCWFHQRIKIDWPMIWSGPAIRKMEDRLNVWTRMFDDFGLVFHTRYWYHGSNYRKQYKIDKAIRMARLEQNFIAKSNFF